MNYWLLSLSEDIKYPPTPSAPSPEMEIVVCEYKGFYEETGKVNIVHGMKFCPAILRRPVVRASLKRIGINVRFFF